MLGWFKKAFGKKPVDQPVSEPEPVEQDLIAATPSQTEELGVADVEPPDSPVEDTSILAETVMEDKAALVEPEPASPPAEPEPEPASLMPPVPEPEEEEQPLEAAEAAEPSVEQPESGFIEAVAEPAAGVIEQEDGTEVDDETSPAPEETPPEGAHTVDEVMDEETAIDEEAAEQEAPLQQETVQDETVTLSEEPAPVAEHQSSHTQEKPGSKSMFRRLQERLGKTRDALVYRLDRLFLGKKEIDQDLFEQLEEILITSDLGVATTLELLDQARKKVKRDKLNDPQALKTLLRDQILAYIEATEQPAELVLPPDGPFVIMVVGVNGVGKTTTIGKIAAKFVGAGQSVLLVAADTFRAAAINQLKIWGERVGVPVVAQNPGADPSAVVFDGLEYGLTHHHDVIIIDTAGRLHTSVNLMEELKKIKRVIGKKLEGAPHEVMLVLDATTGQNGIAQAKMFHEAVGVSGLTLTKLDGTAKGGIVANICREIKIPVRFIGIGEQLDDLRDFEAREFVDALFARPAE